MKQVTKTQVTKILAAAGVMALSAGTASADILYELSSTSVVNCSGAPHGLWTNTVRPGGGSCAQFFDIQAGSTLLVRDDGTGQLTATAMNPGGITAIIDIALSGFEEMLPSGSTYKREGGPAYDPLSDTPDIDFYTGGSGTIVIGGDVYTLNAADPFTGTTLFQFGGDDMLGANAKDNDWGASAWLNVLDVQGAALPHWDLNLDFESARRVPAPGALMLFGLGALGLGAVRRRVRG